MELALPEDIASQLERCNAVLAALEEKAKPFLNRSAKDLDSQLDPTERAQVHLALARTLNSLLALYLKASGLPPEEHGLESEQERLKAYSKKVAKAVAEKELAESRRSLEVNVAALNRMVTHAVPDLSVEQRAALKQGGADRKGAAAEAGEAGGEQQPGGRKRARRGAGPRDEALAFLEEAMAEVRQAGGSGGGGVVSGGAEQPRL